MNKKASTSEVIDIPKLGKGSVSICIRGTSPLICNRLSEKAKHTLLLPSGRKTSAEKAQTVKHNPIEEYRLSPYLSMNEKSPTAIEMLSSMIKKGMMTAALELPGVQKSKIGRLTYVENERFPVFGIPRILLSVTRSADMNKTPDVRTRAIIPRWAAMFSISFVTPTLNQVTIANLVSGAGIVSGLGDWRIEKGSGSYGGFEIVDPDDSEFLEIVKEGGRQAQLEALENPVAYDAETEELLGWFDIEIKRRGLKIV